MRVFYRQIYYIIYIFTIICFYSLSDVRCSQVIHDLFKKVRDVNVAKADQWKAVPDSAYYEEEKQPAVIYGVYHLLRLFGIGFTI